MGQSGKFYHPSVGRFIGRSVIYGAEGDHDTAYMTRYWIGGLRLHIFHRGDQDPDCHDHPWDFWTFPLRSYVEEVLEERVRTVWKREAREQETYFVRHVNIVRAFRLHFRRAEHCHRVLGAFIPFSTRKAPFGTEFILSEKYGPVCYAPIGTVPTIVWRGPIRHKWGFTKADKLGKWCRIAWKKYVYEGGKEAPCQDE